MHIQETMRAPGLTTRFKNDLRGSVQEEHASKMRVSAIMVEMIQSGDIKLPAELQVARGFEQGSAERENVSGNGGM
jgi:hypothetical protein